MDINIKITLKDKPNLLANATVSLNTITFGFVTIKNFAIWKSKHFNDRLQEAINITPPATRGFKYTPIVFFETRDKWFDLEQQIYQAFNASRTSSKDEDIYLDEVDAGIKATNQEENKARDY